MPGGSIHRFGVEYGSRLDCNTTRRLLEMPEVPIYVLGMELSGLVLRLLPMWTKKVHYGCLTRTRSGLCTGTHDDSGDGSPQPGTLREVSRSDSPAPRPKTALSSI